MRKQQGRVGGDHQRGSKGFYIARARCRKEYQRRLAIQGFSHTATAEILGRTTVMQCSVAVLKSTCSQRSRRHAAHAGRLGV